MAKWWNPFDDAGGAFQGESPGVAGVDPGVLAAGAGFLTGGGSSLLGQLAMGSGLLGAGQDAGLFGNSDAGGAGFGRGQPGSGVAPDKANFTLGWDPSRATNLAGTAAGIGAQGQEGARVLGEQAGNQRGTAGYYVGEQGGIPGRDTPQADFGRAQGAIGGANALGGQQGANVGRILDASGRTTDSGAQAQFQQGANQAMNSALSLARSGSGFGGSAATMSNAIGQAPSQIMDAANRSAQIKAQADQADASRQLSALGLAGTELGTARGQGIETAGVEAGMAQDQAALGLQGMSLNDAQRLGLANLGLGYENLASDTGLGAFDAGISAQLGAGQLGLGAEQLGLAGAEAGLAGMTDYERALNELYGIDANYRLGSRNLGQQASRDRVQGVLGGIEAFGSFFGG